MSDSANMSGPFFSNVEGGDSELRQYRTLVNTIDDGLYQLDAEGHFIAVNDVITEVTGYTREELLGTHVSLILDEVDIARVETVIRGLLKSGPDTATLDLPVKTSRGDVIPCELRMSLLQSDGALQGSVGVVRDISNRLEREANLASVTGRYESLVNDVLDGADVGVFVLDEARRVAWVNEAAEGYFGLDRADVLGRDKRAILDEYLCDAVTDPDEFAECVRKGPDDAPTDAFECHVLPSDGRAERWLEHRSQPIETGRYAGGRVELYYDVTERKQTEQARNAAKRQHATLVSNVPGMVYRCRNERGWPMEFVSEGTGDLVEYDPELIENGTIEWGPDIVHPDDREHVWKSVQEGLSQGGQFTVQYRVLTAAGDIRWVSERGQGILDDSGAVTAIEGVITDITEQKETEQALRESEQRFRSIVEAVEEYAIFMLDPDGHVMSWNEGTHRLKGYTEAEILGKHFSTFYTDDDVAAGLPAENLGVAATEGSMEQEGWRIRNDGSRFWANVTITAIRDDDGSLLGYAKVTRDMTERKRSEAERELLYETTRDIAAADTFEDGLEAALADICDVAGWEYAEAWVPNTAEELHRVSSDDYQDDLASFAAFSEDMALARGEGLPGRVWASGESEWVTDLSTESHDSFLRFEEAFDAGLTSVLGVPVVANDEVVAVLTFLGRTVRGKNEQMATIVESVAVELGELFVRRRAETDLAREQELTGKILETAPVGIIVFGPDGSVKRVNSQIASLLGFSDDTMQAYTIGELDLYDPDGTLLPFEDRPAGRAIKTGEPVVGQEITVELPDGRTRWLSVNVVPITDDDGIPHRFVAAATDVTKLKAQAQRLKRQREDLAAELDEVFTRIDDAFYALDDEFRFTYANERAEELLQRDEDELLGERIWELFPEATETPAWNAFHTALESQDPTSFEVYFEPLAFWVEANVYPSETGLSVYFRDVTERKAREEELKQYQSALETIWDGVTILDSDDRFVLVNDGFCEMTGYEREEVIGEHATLILDESVYEKAGELHQKVESGTLDVATLEYNLHRADGSTIPVEARFGPYEFENVPAGGVGVIRDVTKRKARERALAESERRYRTLVDSFPQGAVALFDENLQYQVVGGQLLDDLGIAPEDPVGDTIYDRYPDALTERVEPYFRGVFDGESASFEEEYYDRHLAAQIHPVRNADGDVFAGMLLVQDISERKAREEELERYETVIETITDGVYAVDEQYRFEMVNEGYVQITGYDREELIGNHISTVVDEHAVEIGNQRRAEFHDGGAETGIVELDIERADGDRRTVETRYAVLPFEDEFHGTVGVVRDVTERKAREEQLDQQRARLAALNNLNEVVRDVMDAVIDQSTREEVESILCERLAASESYAFAWIGDVTGHSDLVQLRTEAGIEDYLGDITISVDPDDPRSHGPTGRAFQTHDVQVSHDVHSDEGYAYSDDTVDWRDRATEYGYRSSAAIPITHEDSLYGVLNVYAERPDAFTGEEREVVGHLGELVGHAIASVERKRALTSDEVTELDFLVEDVFADLDVPAMDDGQITLDQAVPTGENEYLLYGTAPEAGMRLLEAVVEGLPNWEEVRPIGEGFDQIRFELRLSEPPILTAIATYGGYIEGATIQDGDLHMAVQLPQRAESGRLIEAVREVYPTADVRAKRQVARSDDGSMQVVSVFEDKLTDRQRSAVESAYFAGYFEWPRESSGEDVATSLDISPSTFTQHLRAAENKIFSALFESAG